MTFPLQKPGGWTDDVDAIEGSQITNIDVNLSNALDGGSGGLYEPSGAIIIDGSGIEITNCIGHTDTADYVLNSDIASFQYRVDRTTINPGPIESDWVIDTSSDIYIPSGPCLIADASFFMVTLNVTDLAYQMPTHGDRIIVRKHVVLPLPGPQTDDARLVFLGRNDVTPLPTSPYLLGWITPLTALQPPKQNPYEFVEFVFDGNADSWRVLDASEQFVGA